MKECVQTVVILSCLLIGNIVSAVAQQSLMVGPVVGYSFGVPLTVTRDPGIVNRYGANISGVSYDHLGWAGVRAFMPSLLGKNWSVSAELSLALSSGKFTSDPFLFDSVYIQTSDQYTGTYRNFDVATFLGMLQLDAQARYNLFGSWEVGAGPWLTYRMSSGMLQEEHIVGTDNAVFFPSIVAEERTQTISSGKSLASSPWRGGLIVSLTRNFSLGNSVVLAPDLHARLDATALLVDKLGIRSLRGGLGLTLLFNTESSSPPPEKLPPDTVYIQTPVADVRPRMPDHKPKLEARIQLFSEGRGGKSDTAVVRKNLTYFRQSAELLPLVFFDTNSAAIPLRYKQLSEREVGQFSIVSLARLSPVDVYYHTLNVLALRLKAEPSARLELTGEVAQGEPRSLAYARAESVKNYLRDVWNIAESRISVQENDGISRRCVLFSSSSPSIVAPLVVEWKVQEFVAPPVRLAQAVRAEAGIRSWELTLVHNGREVGRYEGTMLQELDDLELSFRANNRSGDSVLAPLQAELVVEDYTGTTATSRAELPLVWEEYIRDGQATQRGETENMSVVLLPSTLGKPDVPEKNQVLRTLMASVRDGARITIASLAHDNEAVAEETLLRPDHIAETMLLSLKARNIRVAELHIQRQSDDDPTLLAALPEGDLFRSAVRVVVIQGERQ